MKRMILIVLLTCMAGLAQASLDGRDMEGRFYYPDLGSLLSTDSWTVGPGVDFSGFPSADNRTDLDVSANNIQMTFISSSTWSAAAHNGPVFEVLSPGADISSVSINPATNLAGFDMTRVSWTPTTITVNWQGLTFATDEVISLDVDFGSLTATPVPSMSTLGLVFLAGLLLVIGVVRSRRTQAA